MSWQEEFEDQLEVAKGRSVVVPWSIVERAAEGDDEAIKMIGQDEAQKLVAEADLAARLNSIYGE